MRTVLLCALMEHELRSGPDDPKVSVIIVQTRVQRSVLT